jgi:hypothetical protein
VRRTVTGSGTYDNCASSGKGAAPDKQSCEGDRRGGGPKTPSRLLLHAALLEAAADGTKGVPGVPVILPLRLKKLGAGRVALSKCGPAAHFCALISRLSGLRVRERSFTGRAGAALRGEGTAFTKAPKGGPWMRHWCA